MDDFSDNTTRSHIYERREPSDRPTDRRDGDRGRAVGRLRVTPADGEEKELVAKRAKKGRPAAAVHAALAPHLTIPNHCSQAARQAGRQAMASKKWTLHCEPR